jgi:hypothetical protein
MKMFSCGAAVVAAVGAALMSAPVALASHETREMELQDKGMDLYVFAGVVALVVLGLVAFAGLMLWWERSDDGQEA